MSIEPENPYATPVSDPIPAINPILEAPLATLGARFVGALVDGLILFAIIFPIAIIVGMAGIVKPASVTGNFVYTIVMGLVGFAIFLAINWKPLNATGQTIGKKTAKTRIVTLEGEKPLINDIIKRYAFYNFIGLIPLIGWIFSLVDIFFIFKSDRRCIHDLVAKTKVVQATV